MERRSHVVREDEFDRNLTAAHGPRKLDIGGPSEPREPAEPNTRAYSIAPTMDARVLMLVGDSYRARDLQVALRGIPGIDVDVRVGPLAELSTALSGVDLVAIDVSAPSGAALSWGIRLLRTRDDCTIVFFCDDPFAPELAAIKALGVVPTLIAAGTRSWFSQTLPALVRVARAKGALKLAERQIEPLFGASAQRGSGTIPVPLPVAEWRFRETYVRSILAATGNRVEAAQRAGIPYRTLCKIVQAMEIDPTQPWPADELPKAG